MINDITIENFKCFSKRTSIQLSNITACVGMNSVGKSTLIQAILLLRQTYEIMNRYRGSSKKKFLISLNDKYGLHLGTVDQILSSHTTNNILISINNLDFVYKEIIDDQLSLMLETNLTWHNLSTNRDVFAKNFFYLNCERIGPRDYQIMERNSGDTCGYYGENTFDIINRGISTRVSEVRKFPFTKGKGISTLPKQIEYWLDYIIPGIEFSVTSNINLRLSQLQLSEPMLDTGFGSPYNFGFGISYVLPVIVSGLIAPPGSILIVENPEAHLHPSGQSRIGQFLSQVSQDNLQVIIETHSEHVINGIRVNSLRHDIDPSKVCINFFSIDDKAEHHIERIELTNRMDITKWPKGFFDQEEIDLRELRHLRGYNK